MRIHSCLFICTFALGLLASAAEQPKFETNVEIRGREDQVKASFEIDEKSKDSTHAWLKLEDTYPDSTKSTGAVHTEVVAVQVDGLTYDRAEEAIDYKDKAGKIVVCATHVSSSVFGGLTYDKKEGCVIEVEKRKDTTNGKFSLHTKWSAHVSLKVI